MNDIYNLSVIGERIKLERKAADLSQDKLGEKLNYKRQTIAKWEKGDSFPELADLLKLCNLFGCELGYLLGEYDCKTREVTDVQKITGLSEQAILNLAASASDQKASINKTLAESSNDRLRLLATGQYAKMRFINALLEDTDTWEGLASSTYEYKMFESMRGKVNTIRREDSPEYKAAVEQMAANSMLLEFMKKIDWRKEHGTDNKTHR